LVNKYIKVITKFGSLDESTKKGNEPAKSNKYLKVDKNFSEEYVANKVDSNESIEQEIQVVKEKNQ
jgi:hypothetical protein